MKRSPLNRKTPLKRKTPINPISKKKQNADRALQKTRRLFKENRRCHCCGSRKADDTHEISSGGSRQVGFGDRATWLAVCRKCHNDIHHNHKTKWPLARQLAAKKKHDPEYYDRKRVLEIKGLAETAVTEEEVDEWLE